MKNEGIYSYLNKENFSDAQYTHAKIVSKDFRIKNLGEFHDFYAQNDTLLLADVFENFKNMSIKIYEIEAARFLTALGLAWKATLS